MPAKESYGIGFGDSEVQRNFRKIYSEVICVDPQKTQQERQDLNPLEFRLYCHILRTSNNCYEMLETIGEVCGGKRRSSAKKNNKPISMSKNTVSKGLWDLKEKNFLFFLDTNGKQIEHKKRNKEKEKYVKKIKTSILGISSLDQIYVDRELDEYGFTPSEFRVYFHLVFKYCYEIDRDNEFVKVGIKEDSAKLKGVSPRSLQVKLRILELANVIKPQTHIYATNRRIRYKVNPMNLWKDAVPHLIRARDRTY